MTFPQRVQRRLRQLHPQERGGFLVEALVVSVIVTFVSLSTVNVCSTPPTVIFVEPINATPVITSVPPCAMTG